jgi:hypothetical protein
METDKHRWENDQRAALAVPLASYLCSSVSICGFVFALAFLTYGLVPSSRD